MSSPTSIPGRVRRRFQRPPASVVEALSGFPSGIVSDCLNRMGAMTTAIAPVGPPRRMCGPALTVDEVEGGNLMSHLALTLVEPGDVLVIAARGTMTRSAWGGVQAAMARQRGAAGVVVDGCIRDVDDLEGGELPVFARGAAPAGPLKGWAGSIGYPVACGGVAVQAGDVVVGDADGVVVVPADLAPELPSLCERRTRLERGWTEGVAEGASTLDLLGLEDTVRRLGIRFEED